MPSGRTSAGAQTQALRPYPRSGAPGCQPVMCTQNDYCRPSSGRFGARVHSCEACPPRTRRPSDTPVDCSAPAARLQNGKEACVVPDPCQRRFKLQAPQGKGYVGTTCVACKGYEKCPGNKVPLTDYHEEPDVYVCAGNMYVANSEDRRCEVCPSDTPRFKTPGATQAVHRKSKLGVRLCSQSSVSKITKPTEVHALSVLTEPKKKSACASSPPMQLIGNATYSMQNQ